MQRVRSMKKAGFTPAFFITSSCHFEKAAGFFKVNMYV
jgi:hypothetical protein